MDEDTCASNFMVRDGRKQQLVAREQEPIRAFIDRVRQLYDKLDVSTVLVMGGSGDYFEVADCVIHMASFVPKDVTEEAEAIARTSSGSRSKEVDAPFHRPTPRVVDARDLVPINEYGHTRISPRDRHHLVFGQIEIDVSDLEQISEIAQTRAVGRAINYARRYLDGTVLLRDAIQHVMRDVEEAGLDVLDADRRGDLAEFRGLELTGFINRIHGLAVSQGAGPVA